jgi:hypothetical protein
MEYAAYGSSADDLAVLPRPAFLYQHSEVRLQITLHILTALNSPSFLLLPSHMHHMPKAIKNCRKLEVRVLGASSGLRNAGIEPPRLRILHVFKNLEGDLEESSWSRSCGFVTRGWRLVAS